MGVRKVLFINWQFPSAEACDPLPAHEWEVHIAPDLAAATRLLAEHHFLVGFLHLSELDAANNARLDSFLQAHEAVEWVGGFELQALQAAACRDLILDRLFDHVTIPVDARRLSATLGHAYGHASLRLDRKLADTTRASSLIVGQSAAMILLTRQIGRIAKVDAPALVIGESGSGKELVAQAIHAGSGRAKGPFVVVNCGAIPATLIQSELFGHEKGSFTGAGRQTRGLIETASGGTLFLDEIGDLPLELQSNLLRFMQESTIHRVGSSRSIRVDVRVVAATHVDLEAAVAAGTFRQDLFYRLNVLPLAVPPLRERGEDIELLAQHFFKKFANDGGRRLKRFSRHALVAMNGHDWPGNVRELINRVRRAMVLGEGHLVQPGDLGLSDCASQTIRIPLDQARLEAERHAISGTLQFAGKNVTHAARHLGISRMTLYRLMAKHHIEA